MKFQPQLRFKNKPNTPQRIVSLNHPKTTTYYHNFLLKFIYHETTLPQFQSDLGYLLAHEPALYEYFFAFLKLNTDSIAKENAARQYFCSLTGLPAEVPSSRRRRPSMQEMEQFNDMVSVSTTPLIWREICEADKKEQERFSSCPGKLRDFLLLNLRRWRQDGSEVVRGEIVELLDGEEDLLEIFERVWPRRGC
jgi:hypothetical protein